MFIEKYYDNTAEIIQTIFSEESPAIEKAGTVLAEVFKQDGLVHVFGCGHSHMIEEELFYRAGGLALINPIFETSAMLHKVA